MKRIRLAGAVLAAVLLLPAVAHGQPSITSVTPSLTAANTGATVTVIGSGFGAADDRVWFQGTDNWVNPSAFGSGWVVARVPETWSGDVRVQSHGAGALSNGIFHEISFTWTGTKWNTADLPFEWWLHEDGAPGCTVTDTRSRLVAGYDTWACASDVTHAYQGTTATTGADHGDGVNVQWWSNSGWANDGTIAVCSWRYWTASGDIIEYDISYNSQYFTWSCAGAAGAMDVENIATHEEGHSTGLGDLYGDADNLETMYGWTSDGVTQGRTLEPDDVEGAEFMYPHTGRANFVSGTPGGWYGPLVPRMLNDATDSYAPLPATLTGNSTCYLNSAMRNSGSDCAAPFGVNHLLLDDAYFYWCSWSGVWSAGLTMGAWRNISQTVRGGRHTLRAEYDWAEEIVESSEADNIWQAQFVWSPYLLANETPVSRSAAPVRGPFTAHNCDGFRFTGHWWGCVAVLPTDADEDYDVQLFDDYAGSTTGFSTALATSSWGAGSSDFVLVNGNMVGANATRWAGVYSYLSDPAASFRISQSNEVATLYSPETYDTWTTYTDTIGAYQVALVYEVHLDSTSVTYRFELDNTSGTADLNISLYDRTGDYFGKSNYAAISQAVGAGTDEAFEFKPASAGFYGLVVWKRNASDNGKSNTYTLRIGAALGNLDATVVLGGWDAPAVPRSDATAAGGNVHVTPTLNGNTSDTYYNWTVYVDSPNPLPSWRSELWLDEVGSWYFNYTGQGSFPVYTLNNGPNTVRGGRHTLASTADVLYTVAETSESDNIGRAQYVWSPLTVNRNTPVVRARPPVRGPLANPNCDGMRFTPTAGYAWLTSLVSSVTDDDYDLFVYDDYAGSTSGFSNLIRDSQYGGNATEYVVAHYSGTPDVVYPAAVYWSHVTGGSFVADQTDAQGRAGASGGGSVHFANVTLPANRLADVFEGYFITGRTYHIGLLRNSGTADLRFSVFPGTAGGVYRRSEAAAYSATVSTTFDSLAFSPAVDGWHPIVVYRPSGGDLAAVVYDLTWNERSLVDVPGGEPPAALSFAGAVPNPVTGQARFAFALPQAGRVQLVLYDLNGRLVGTLADGWFEVGNHTVSWDGTDRDGARVGAGLYWARLAAGGREFTRRVTVLR
jgi:hypothetical protein